MNYEQKLSQNFKNMFKNIEKYSFLPRLTTAIVCAISSNKLKKEKITINNMVKLGLKYTFHASGT